MAIRTIMRRKIMSFQARKWMKWNKCEQKRRKERNIIEYKKTSTAKRKTRKKDEKKIRNEKRGKEKRKKQSIK